MVCLRVIPAILFAVAAADPTSRFRVVTEQRGLDSLSTQVLDAVNAKFASGFDLDDIHIDTHVAEPIGHITLDLTEITVTTLHLQSGRFGAPPSGAGSLALNLTNLELAMSLGYKWRKVNWPHGSDHGTITATESKGDIGVLLDIIPDAKGPPSVSGTSLVTVGQFDFKFHGKIDWLYNVFVSAFHGVIKNSLVKKINDLFDEAINVDLAQAIANLPTSISIGGGKSKVGIGTVMNDFTVVPAPLALSSGISLDLTDNETEESCPEAPTSMIPTLAPRSSNSMLQLLIADVVPSCVFWIFYRNGLFEVPRLLDGTTDEPWGSILPPLKKQYPGMPVVLHLTPTYAPHLKSFSARGFSGSSAYNVTSYVASDNTSNATLTYTHQLFVQLRFDVNVSVRTSEKGENATLVGKVGSLDLNASVSDSAIGRLPEGRLDLFASIFSDTVRGIINRVLGQGVQFTGDDISLENITVFTEDGFLTIATDFDFEREGHRQVLFV